MVAIRKSLFIILVISLLIVTGCASGAGDWRQEPVGQGPQTAARTVASESAEAPAADLPVNNDSYNLHRYALVIGNGNYEEGALANPVNDADLMTRRLKETGFDVSEYRDLRKSGIDDAVSAFVKTVNRDPEAVALFYYAGHGVEVDGVNYLIPVDNAKIESEADVKIYAYSLDSLLSLLQAGEQIVILDACRNNPYRMSGDRAAGVKGGLGALKEAKRGVNLSYLFAAQSGQTAKDGEGGNSVFTAILADEIVKGNVPLSQLFNNVAVRVKAMTDSEQVPLSSTTGSDFVFQSEKLANAVLAKKVQLLRDAEAEIKRLENKAGSGSEAAAALASAQAKLALAQAEKDAAEKRAAQVEADAAKTAREMEEAAQRSAELQAQIDNMTVLAENAALLARQAAIEQFDIGGAIREIENNKLSWYAMKSDEDALLAEKRAALEAALVVTLRQIDTAGYAKAELDANGNPTEMALKVREVRKDAERQAMEAEYDAYVKSVSGSSSGQRSDLLNLIREEIAVVEHKTFTLSSVLENLTIRLDQFDGERGGWNLHVTTDLYGYNGNIFTHDFFLPYETVTGLSVMKDFDDISQYSAYLEYLNQVEMFDALFRSEVPVIQVELSFNIDVDGGLSYCFIPQSLQIRRADDNRVILDLSQDSMASFWGNEVYMSLNGIDIRTEQEKQADMIDMSVYSKVLFPGRTIPQRLELSGTVVGGLLVNDWYLKNSSYAVLPYGDESTDPTRRLYGWSVNRYGSVYAEPVGSVVLWQDGDPLPQMLYCNLSEVEFIDCVVISTTNGDTVVNPGEDVYFDLIFKNSGSAVLKNPSLYLMTPQELFPADETVTLTERSRNWLSLSPGRYLNGSSTDNFSARSGSSYYYSLSVSENHKASEPIVLYWLIEGDDHPQWFGTFEIPVSEINSDITLEGVKILGTTDGDDVPEQGEYVYFDLAFLNYGTSRVMNPEITLVSSTPGVTVEKGNRIWRRADAGRYFNCFDTDLEKLGWYDGSDYSAYAYCIKISDTYDTSRPVSLTWQISGDSHSDWNGNFTIDVKKKTQQDFLISPEEPGTSQLVVDALQIVNQTKIVNLVGVRIIDTTDDDNYANPGETVYFDLCFKNTTWFTDLSNLDLTLSTDTPGVTISRGTDHWYSLNGSYFMNSEDSGLATERYSSSTYGCYRIDIDSDYDISEPIKVNWTITCSNSYGYRKEDQKGYFTIPVSYSKGKVELQGMKITSTDNDDSIANPGETVYFDLCFRNTGTSKLQNLRLYIYSLTDGVTLDRSTDSWYYLSAGKYLNCDNYDMESEKYQSGTYYTYSMKVPSDYDVTQPVYVGWWVSATGCPDMTGVFTVPVRYTDGEVRLQGVRITDTDNDDYTANPGETVYFDLCFKNTGTSELLNLNMSLQSLTDGVTIERGTDSWYYLGSGKYLNCDSYDMDKEKYQSGTYYTYSLKVPSNYDVTQPVEIAWRMTAKGRPAMTGVFTIPVKYTQGDVSLQGVRVTSTNNGDLVPNPGETVYFDMCFKNTGSSELLNPNLSLRSLTDGVTVERGTDSWYCLSPGMYLNCDNYDMGSEKYQSGTYYTYSVKIPKDHDVTKPVEIVWTMTAKGRPAMTGAFSFPVK
ncbi:MAG: caspase family protein [Spirochaetales bacterium]|nr:caspase family protein [Spirochaetales bacterium]